MSNTNTGGWAFPAPAGCGEDNGMTLRDYFAAKAIPSALRFHIEVSFPLQDPEGDEHFYSTRYSELWASVAKGAYLLADAMLAERNKQ